MHTSLVTKICKKIKRLKTLAYLGEPCGFVPELAVDVRFCSMRW
jgi:hypothetical protein